MKTAVGNKNYVKINTFYKKIAFLTNPHFMNIPVNLF